MRSTPRRPAAALSLLAALALSASACVAGEPSIADEQLFAGRWVTLHAHPGARICPRTLEYADRFVELTSAFLSLPPRPLHYYLYRDRITHPCPSEESPRDYCALPESGAVLAISWMSEHQMVHAIAGPLGRPPALFEEGLAMMLSYTPSPGNDLPVNRLVALEANLESAAYFAHARDARAELYAAAGAFLRFVSDNFGFASLRALYSELDYHASAATIHQAFFRNIGISLEGALQLWRASPPQSWQSVPLKLAQCSDPTLQLAPDGTLGRSGELMCGGPGHGTPLTELETFDVAEDGLYLFRLEGPERFTGILSGCGRDDESPQQLSLRSGLPRVRLAPLRAGRHFLQFEQERMDSRETPPATLTRSWSLERVGAESGSCEEAPLLRIPAEVRAIDYRTPPDHWRGRAVDPDLGPVNVTWLRVETEVPRRIDVYPSLLEGRFVAEPLAYTVCTGPCGAPTACQSTTRWRSRLDRVDLAPGTTLTIELRAPGTAEDQRFGISFDDPS